MNSSRIDPRILRDRAKAVCLELMNLGLEKLDEHERRCLISAVTGWVKWEKAATVAEFIDARKLAGAVSDITGLG